ncbi:MAG: hypothetical protein H7232_04830 [Aeromicrobium sp.]|nr:hypothetical protein [Burkholderiales bacterium]
MPRLIKQFLITLCVCVSCTAWANTITNDDVIKLVKAGLSEAVILQTIDAATTVSFDTTTDGQIKLKQAGVTDAVVGRMVGKKAGGAAAVSAVGSACKLASGDENLLAIVDGTRQINIGYRVAEMEADVSAGSTLANVFTLGIVAEKGKYSAVVAGSASGNRIKSRQPVFPDLVAPTGQQAEDTFYLVKLSPKGGRRAVIVGEASGGLFGYKEKMQFPPGAEFKLSLKKRQDSCTINGDKYAVYEGTPTVALAPGEYAIMYGDHFYDFAVEP